MNADAVAYPPFRSIAVVGVGLIGGSVAAAVKRRGLSELLVGIGRSRDRLKAARESGLVDVVSTEMAAAEGSELVVICTPVDRIAVDVREAASYCRCPSIVTDAGSIKKSIGDDLAGGLPDGVRFIGSHPLAGSEKTGWENADAELFQDRLCVITPQASDEEDDVQTVESFWRQLGMRTRRMSPDEHDRALALTSHLPHAAAAAIASLLTDDLDDLTATGFCDTTRIAAGDPNIWTGIFRLNSTHLASHIDRLIERLAELRDLASQQDANALHALLSEAKSRRDALGDR